MSTLGSTTITPNISGRKFVLPSHRNRPTIFKIDFITTQQNYVMKVIITVTENNDHKIFISKIFKHFVNNLAQF